MTMIRIAVVTLTATLNAGLCFGQPNVTQTVHDRMSVAMAKMRSSCATELATYCSSVSPGEGRLLLCMQAHDDKVSAPCLYELHQVSQQLHTVAEAMKDASIACKEDIGKFCASIQPGEGRLAQCLASHQGSVSKACVATLEHLQSVADNPAPNQR